jgi:DNA-binding Lrp family transcriptional regulator
MDAFDVKLLSALQGDGRLTNEALADTVGLSASQCSRRRAALEASGVIEGYRADLAADRLGLAVTVMVQVRLASHAPRGAKSFVDLVHGLDEVQEVYALTGEADYLVKIVLADLAALSRILNDVLLPHPSVAQVRSSVVLERLKETRRLPLGHLAKPPAPIRGRRQTRRRR